MAEYEKQTWTNGPSTPLSPSRLGHLETQFDRAVETVTELIGTEGSPLRTEIDTAIGGVAAATMANPESELNSETVQVVQGVLGGGTANLLKLNAASIDSLAAPRIAGGPNLWLVASTDYDADLYPSFFQSGDLRARATETTAPFDPLAVAGLEEFWEAARVSGLANGDPVATIVDESPLAHSYTQSDATRRPIFTTDVRNGHPAFVFDGTNDTMRTGAFAAIDTHGLTEYSVFSGGASVNSGSSKFLKDKFTPTSTTQGGALYRSAANKWVFTRGTAATLAAPDSDALTHVVKVKYAASGLLADVYLDGVLVIAGGAIGNTAAQTFVERVLGSRADSPNGANYAAVNWFSGAAVRNISTDDEAAFDAYFHDRYLA